MILFQNLYFDQVGHEHARFHDLSVELDDPVTGTPADTLVSIRNAGGKTSILALLFSLFLPSLNQFVWQKTEGRTLGDYVLTNDTSLVAARVVTSAGVVVVASYYEWPDRRRPVDYETKMTQLDRHWFVFNPDPAVLDIDSLPRVDDAGRLLTLREVTAELDRISHDNPRLRLTVSRKQNDFAKALTDHGVDVSLLAAQLQVVGQEGGFEKLFTTDSELDFVNRLIGLLYDEKAADTLAEAIRKNADLLGRLPSVQLELQFARDVADRMATVQESALARADATAAYDDARVNADSLASSLREASTAAQANAATATSEADVTQIEIDKGYTARNAALNQHKAYQHIEANLRVEHARSQHSLLDESVTDARTELRAWEAVDQVIATRTASAELDRLQASATELAMGADVERTALARAASLYRGGLDAFIDAAEIRLTGVTDAEGAARKQLDRLTQDHGALAAARQENAVVIAQLEHQLRELDKEVRRAQTAGDLASGQTPADAVTHWNTIAANAMTALEHHRAEISVTESALATLEGTEREASDELNRCTESLRLADGRWHLLEAAHAELVTDETVREIVGVDDVDPWAARSILTERLAERLATLETEVGALADEQERAKRTLAALSDSGLLPPSDDVRDVLAVLERAGVRAVAGYAYLARSVSTLNREATIEAHPGLCAGVVVDAEYRATARAALADLHLTGLVVVGTKEGLEATADVPHLVVMPVAAAYDPDAAPELRMQVERAVIALAERRLEVATELTLIRSLADRLRAFFERVPIRKSFLDTRSAFEESRTALEEAGLAVGNARTQRTTLTGHLAGLRASFGLATETLHAADVRRERLAPLVEHYALAPDLGRQLNESDRQRSNLESDAAELARAIERTETQRRDAVDASSALRRDIQSFVNERTRVGDVPTGDVPAGVDLADLRQAWVTAGDELHRAVTDGALSAKIAAATSRLADEKIRLGQYGPEAADRADELVEHNGDAIDAANRQIRLEGARRTYEQLVAALDGAQRHLDTWTELLTKRSAPAPASAGSSVAAIDEPAEAERLAEAASAAEERIRAEVAAMEKHRDELRDQAAELATTFAHFTNAAASLEATGADPLRVRADPYAGTPAEAAPAAQVATRTLVAAQAAVTHWDTALKDRVQVVRELPSLSTYVGLSRNVTASIAGLSVAILASADEATRQEDAWRVRADELAGEMERLDQHREISVTDLTGEMVKLLGRLSRAEHVSKMPVGLGEWSGQSFLRIRFENPREDIAAFRFRMGEVIDGVVKRKTAVSGLELLRMAAAAAMPNGFRSTLFKPTPDMRDDRMSVTRLGAWSGGERLTAAVVLFCVVAAIRADRTGSRNFSPGALVIDNPLGQASYQPFVLLQRRIAGLMGVQLIYTSAIKDLPALAVFPNVVRLSNVLSGDGRKYMRVERAALSPTRQLAKARVSRTGPPPTIVQSNLFDATGPTDE